MSKLKYTLVPDDTTPGEEDAEFMKLVNKTLEPAVLTRESFESLKEQISQQHLQAKKIWPCPKCESGIIIFEGNSKKSHCMGCGSGWRLEVSSENEKGWV